MFINVIRMFCVLIAICGILVFIDYTLEARYK